MHLAFCLTGTRTQARHLVPAIWTGRGSTSEQDRTGSGFRVARAACSPTPDRRQLQCLLDRGLLSAQAFGHHLHVRRVLCKSWAVHCLPQWHAVITWRGLRPACCGLRDFSGGFGTVGALKRASHEFARGACQVCNGGDLTSGSGVSGVSGVSGMLA